MTAELAALTSSARRRAFARGCAGAVLRTPGTWRTVGAVLALLATGVTVVTLSARGPSVAVFVEVVVLVTILGALAWCGRSVRVLRPARDGTLRVAGYLVVGAYVLLLVSPAMGGARHDPAGWWIAGLAAVVYLAAVLTLTAENGARSARRVVAVAVLGTGVWSSALVVSSGVRERPLLSLGIIAGCAAAAAAGPPEQALLRFLGGGCCAGLLMFLASAVLYTVAPGLAPDVAGPTSTGGLTTADHAATNRAEAADPYVVDLLLGAGLGALVVGRTVVDRVRDVPQAAPTT